MAGLKELKRRLVSVRNTKKITYAMKLVSAAKLRRSQEQVLANRRYESALRAASAALSASDTASGPRSDGNRVPDPLVSERDVSAGIAVVVVGGSRGLAGAYNAAVGRKIDETAGRLAKEHPGVPIRWYLFGRKAVEHARKAGVVPTESFEDLPEDPLKWPVDEVCDRLCADFGAGRADVVLVIYTKFRTALSVTVECDRVLPLPATGATDEDAPGPDPVIEPSPAVVAAALYPRMFRAAVRGACLESKASEHGSRMTAMDAATKNAGELSDALQLRYNKLRQSGITSELLDIIGGSEAIH